MKKLQKAGLLCVVSSLFTLSFSGSAHAMHIMEGYLSPGWCLFWWGASLPFIVAGYYSIREKVRVSPRSLILLALCGAFAFVLSALKIPSVTGSSSHPTGVGLGAILFGPFAMALISSIVLLFQALLLAHGGITTLGANIFSMGIAGPILAYCVYRFFKKAGMKMGGAVFAAAFVGDIATYIVTSLQLALAYPDNGSVIVSFGKFFSIFALTQLPLAVCEGLLTVVVFGVLEKYRGKELDELSVVEGGSLS